jgi:hypothetical protein
VVLRRSLTWGACHSHCVCSCQLTHADVLEKVPEERREEARALFFRFREAFNAVLPLIDTLSTTRVR